MRRTMKALAGICVLAGALFITAEGAGAQLAPTPAGCDDYITPCNPQKISFTYPRTVHAGDVMDIDGKVENVEDKAKASTDTATITMAGQVLGTAAIATDGTFSGKFTVPAGQAVGDYTISASSGTLKTDGPITVIAEGTGTNNNGVNNTSSNNPLARTGFDATPMVTLGAAVLILGAAAVYGSKRRRLA